jgi:hypothetical protein
MPSLELTSVEMIPSERTAMVCPRLRGAFFGKVAIEAERKECLKRKRILGREGLVRDDTGNPESIQDACLHKVWSWKLESNPGSRNRSRVSRSGTVYSLREFTVYW